MEKSKKRLTFFQLRDIVITETEKGLMMATLYHWKFTEDMPFAFDMQFYPVPPLNPMIDFHSSIHINLILEHGMSRKVGNTVFHFKRGDIQITAPWEPHGGSQIEKNLRLLGITTDPDLLLRNLITYRHKALSLFLLEPLERYRIVNTPATRKIRMDYCKALPAITGSNPEIVTIRRWLAVQSMLTELLDCIKSEDLPEAQYRLYQRLVLVLDLFKNGQKISVQEAAEACSLSTRQFSDIFRQVYRMPFSKFEMRNRLSHAASLLRQGLPLKLVAEQTGFYDSSHLSRHFYRNFGITPGKIR